MRVKLTSTLQVCDVCDRYKTKAHAVRKKTYTRASNPVENIFVDKTGPFPESLIGNWYWTDIVDNCSRYSWSFFTNTKSNFPKKMEEFFKNIMLRVTPFKYLHCDNMGEQQSKLQKA